MKSESAGVKEEKREEKERGSLGGERGRVRKVGTKKEREGGSDGAGRESARKETERGKEGKIKESRE